MLFIVLGFMFYLRAVKYAGSERLVRTTSIRPYDMLRAMGAVAQERKYAMSNAVLAGVAFGAASLGWKGFVVSLGDPLPGLRCTGCPQHVPTSRLDDFEHIVPDHVVNQSPNCSAILCTSSNEPDVGWKRSTTVPLHLAVHCRHDVHHNWIP